jgi:N-acylneuraminate cytidylyltransferase
MTTVGIILARGGSKRVPRKNMRTVGGQTLVERAIRSGAGLDRVYVSTDDDEIAQEAEWHGATVHRRHAIWARDTTTSEDAIAVYEAVMRVREPHFFMQLTTGLIGMMWC